MDRVNGFWVLSRGLFRVLAVSLPLFLISLLSLPPGFAQAPPETVAPAPAGAENPAATRQDLDNAIKLLEDDKTRGRVLDQLHTLSKAAEATGEGAERTTLGTRVVSAIRERWADLGALRNNYDEVVSVWPMITQWVGRQAASDVIRQRWGHFLWELVMVLVSGFAAWGLLGWLLSRPRNAINAKTPVTSLGKLPWLTMRAILEALPTVALGVTAYAVLAGTDPAERVRLAALPIINATIAVRLLSLVGNFLLSPQGPGLRLLPVDDTAARHALRHLRNLGLVGFYGWFLAEAVFVLGLPAAAYLLAIKVVGFVVATMMIYRIFRHRRGVARLIRGDEANAETEKGMTEVDGPSLASQNVDPVRLSSVRRRVAEVWHLVAAAYVAVACGVWMLEIKGGFTFMARATLLTAVTLGLARLLAVAVTRGLSHPLRVSEQVNRDFPGLIRRVDSYRPWARRALTTAIWVAAALVALDAWGAGSLAWLAGPMGQRVVGSAITISTAVVLAVAVWAVVSLIIDRALLAEGPDGGHAEKSARTRTLLPLLRNALLVVLIVVLGLFILAESGVNIAPLLAGVGVIGLAISFGSQTLVKDVITGMFILIEDSISVGDVVDVGDGHSGVVEAIAIRTIRLRDVAGTVHTVPYSSVTSIRNLTKDFSFAVFDVEVAYREDVDNVMDVLREIAAGLETDPEFERDILEPLEIMGLDSLAASGVVIKARFKTKPIKQWRVMREFNRRMKRRFDELGISIPFPHRQMIWDPSPDFLAAMRRPVEVKGVEVKSAEVKGVASPVAEVKTPPSLPPTPGSPT